MKHYPTLSLREPARKPRRKPVGFHLNDGTRMLSILLVCGTLAAMTATGESYHIAHGKYDHLKPKGPSVESSVPVRPAKVLPGKFKGGADRYDDIFTAYAADPEAFTPTRKAGR